MFKKIGSALLFLFLLPTAYADAVQDTLLQFMRQQGVPGVAMTMYVDGKVRNEYLGFANREKKIPVTKNSVFEVASITKLFTSMLLAQQIDSANAQLDDSITHYLTALPASFEDMTLENLATHTAGLPFELPDAVRDTTALQHYLETWKPQYGADEDWIYSNIGMGLLGDALVKMTHVPLDRLYQTKICAPLGMSATGLVVGMANRKFIAQGYDVAGNAVPPTTLGLFPSAYALKMSAQDAQKFLAAAIGLPGTPETIFYQMRMTQASYMKLINKKQGLGWEIHSLRADKIPALLHEPAQMNLGPIPVTEIYERAKFKGSSLIDKTGMDEGFSAYIAVVPDKKAGIVIFVNRRLASHNALTNLARGMLFKELKLLPHEH